MHDDNLIQQLSQFDEKNNIRSQTITPNTTRQTSPKTRIKAYYTTLDVESIKKNIHEGTQFLCHIFTAGTNSQIIKILKSPELLEICIDDPTILKTILKNELITKQIISRSYQQEEILLEKLRNKFAIKALEQQNKFVIDILDDHFSSLPTNKVSNLLQTIIETPKFLDLCYNNVLTNPQCKSSATTNLTINTLKTEYHNRVQSELIPIQPFADNFKQPKIQEQIPLQPFAENFKQPNNVALILTPNNSSNVHPIINCSIMFNGITVVEACKDMQKYQSNLKTFLTKNPEALAGLVKAVNTSFPNNIEIQRKIYTSIKNLSSVINKKVKEEQNKLDSQANTNKGRV